MIAGLIVTLGFGFAFVGDHSAFAGIGLGGGLVIVATAFAGLVRVR